MTENELSNKIIGSAIEIHKALGPGFLESACKECLYHKLIQQGLKVDKERPIPLNAKLAPFPNRREGDGGWVH